MVTMSSLCFRRPSGQHFIVFLESISQAIVLISQIKIKDFELIEDLEKYLEIKPGEERIVGFSNDVQLIMTVGHIEPEVVEDYNSRSWPEHCIIIDKAQIQKYLDHDQLYGWPGNMFASKGPFSAILEADGKFFRIPKDHYQNL